MKPPPGYMTVRQFATKHNCARTLIETRIRACRLEYLKRGTHYFVPENASFNPEKISRKKPNSLRAKREARRLSREPYTKDIQ